MASIPLPALDIRPPAQQPDPLEQYGRLMQLKQMQQMQPLQQQAAQQNVQQGALDIQGKQMDIAARQAFQTASANSITKDANGNPTFDADKFQQGIAGTPAFTPATIESLAKMQKARVDLQSSMADLQGKQQDMMGNAANAIKASGYNPTVAHSILDTFPQSPQTQQIRASIDNPQALKQWTDQALAQSSSQQKMQNEQKVAQIRANTPEAQVMNSWLQQNPGKTPADFQQFKVDQGVQADVQKETNPAVLNAKAMLSSREAIQKQALSQGDPNAAAQLLVNGDATLSELKSRGVTPDFIARTLFAAKQQSGGKYNAQQADAAFDVAKSPANVGFFGSAKSLTDQGGTLDQLAAAAKDIPGGQIPIFNSVADAAKAATGNGPIAKYAALMIGATDDYSKVMGGGTGSDASRAAAFKLMPMNASPEARAASIQGIRGAVTSQALGRIGDNQVLKRMYGSQFSASNPQAAPGGLTVTAPNGKVYSFKDQASADAFKQKAGIQ